jgi:hypothetical protein
MSKLYIDEYPGLGATGSGDALLNVFPVPPTASQVLDSTKTTGGINVLGAITAGTLYTNGTYANVPLTGGTGSGAVATVTVAGAAVTAVVLSNRGQGYTAADSLSAAAANIGGTGSGFAVAVTSIAQMSVPFQPSTKFVEVSADGLCSIAFSPAGTLGPVATTTNTRLAVGERKQFAVGTTNTGFGSPTLTQQVGVITNT